MAQWIVVTAGRNVSLPLFVENVVECRSESEGRLRWVVECPESTHSLMNLVAGVLSVEPAGPKPLKSRFLNAA